MRFFGLIFFIISTINITLAQEDLLNFLDSAQTIKKTNELVTSTFKGVRVINSQTVETNSKNNLTFLVLHRFGKLNEGYNNFLGLDNGANVKLGFEYGITDKLQVGIGRTGKPDKNVDLSLKYKLLRQSTGYKAMPVSVVLYFDASVKTRRESDKAINDYFVGRLAYVYQAIIARKFSSKLSLQLMPTIIHRNLVETPQDQNDVFAGGAAGRLKITKRTSINAEYFYLLPGKTADEYANCFSVGFDIETGGHLFQLFFTNAQGIIEKEFIAENIKSNSLWNEGDISFGFNISRAFNLKSSGRNKVY